MGIILFNLYGYQPVFHYLQLQEEEALCDRIYKGVSEEELISIKVFASLPPYAQDSRNFEWVDGEVDMKGVVYKYVQRRIFKDSIEYRCIPNHGKNQVEVARTAFFRLSNDLETSDPAQKTTSVSKPFCFESVAAETLFSNIFPQLATRHFRPFRGERLPLSHLSFQGQPPECNPALPIC
jgi:hypothetical protein